MIENVSGFDLLAVDKVGGRVLFLDPATLEIRKAIDDLPPKPHELLILPRRGKAYVPIFGDGIHGDNPNLGHHIAVVDLQSESVASLIDISPYRAPHTARLGTNGLIYCCCEASAAVVVIDPEQDRMTGSFTPGGRFFLVANENSGSISVIDLLAGQTREHIPVPVGCEVLGYFPHLPA